MGHVGVPGGSFSMLVLGLSTLLGVLLLCPWQRGRGALPWQRVSPATHAQHLHITQYSCAAQAAVYHCYEDHTYTVESHVVYMLASWHDRFWL
jgi:hypothetical protein